MNMNDYLVWEADARRALSAIYSVEETTAVLDWFRRIKSTEERALVGDDAVNAMLVFVTAQGGFNLYNSLMARLFVYAPLILRNARGG